jgi:hypothetical protein
MDELRSVEFNGREDSIAVSAGGPPAATTVHVWLSHLKYFSESNAYPSPQVPCVRSSEATKRNSEFAACAAGVKGANLGGAPSQGPV